MRQVKTKGLFETRIFIGLQLLQKLQVMYGKQEKSKK